MGRRQARARRLAESPRANLLFDAVSFAFVVSALLRELAFQIEISGVHELALLAFTIELFAC